MRRVQIHQHHLPAGRRGARAAADLRHAGRCERGAWADAARLRRRRSASEVSRAAQVRGRGGRGRGGSGRSSTLTGLGDRRRFLAHVPLAARGGTEGFLSQLRKRADAPLPIRPAGSFSEGTYRAVRPVHQGAVLARARGVVRGDEGTRSGRAGTECP